MQHLAHNENVVYLTFDSIERWFLEKSSFIKSLNPALCVGILRGGLFPAMLASFVTDAPLAFLRFNRTTGEVLWDQNVQIPAPGSIVLLCEDLAGSGVTLTSCKSFLEQQGLIVKTLTIFKDSKSRLNPDVAMDMSGKKVVLPWERHTVLPGYIDYQSKMHNGIGAMPPDGQWQRWGFDLDGVFLDDVHEKEYEQDLQMALHKRSLLPKDPLAPTPPLDSMIITGRPEQDRQLTLAWLEQHALSHLPLCMRDESKYSAKNTPLYKSIMAFENNLTHFWESDLYQAVNIAKYNPGLHVLWWNVQSKEGIWIWARCAQEQVQTFSAKPL